MLKHVLTIVGVLIVAFLSGCSSHESPSAPQEMPSTPPDGVAHSPTAVAEVTSAVFNIYVGFPNQQSLNLHRITDDWEPATTSWNTFGGAFSPNIEGSFSADVRDWHQVDITALVESWALGEQNNFGFLIDQATPWPAPAMLHSQEMSGYAPFLVLDYVTSEGPACDTVLPTADLFIDQAAPNMTTEGGQILLVGQLMTSGSEKQSLLRFDVPSITFQVDYAAVAGQTWEDVDQDGIRDNGEPAFSGVAVSLYNCEDSLLENTTTDATGAYQFDSLLSGSFVVGFAAPAGYQFSPANQGSDDTIDSDADPTTGRSECFLVREGETSLNWDAGLYLTEVVESGCTHGKGYWKNHAGTNSQNDEVTPLLPIWLGDEGGQGSLLVDDATAAVAVLSMKVYGDPSNGITKLYAHLLATKLNIAAGADDADIAATVAEADAFLAAHLWEDWDGLERDEMKSVLAWKDQCEQFNEGEIGPGSCDGLAEQP